MKPNDERKLTFDEKVELLYQEMMASRLPTPKAVPKAAPKPAVVKANERWSQKPIEAVIRDEAAHNQTLIERLRAEREAKDAELRHALYQGLIDVVWQNQLDCQAELRGLGRPSFHKGPGDPDW
jgi:hypothetical protein